MMQYGRTIVNSVLVVMLAAITEYALQMNEDRSCSGVHKRSRQWSGTKSFESRGELNSVDDEHY